MKDQKNVQNLESSKRLEDLENLEKSELCLIILELQEKIENLENQIESKKTGRKQILFDIMSNHEHFSLNELSKKMTEVCGKPISSKNISSLLTYLRTDEVPICTDHLGKKFILEEV